VNIESLRNYCLSKKGVTEEFPFDENTLVFKVMGKMFALADVEEFEGINLKCEPEEAIQLREKYDAVQPGYHMSKKHWNTIIMDGSIPDKLIYKWIDDSYVLVVDKLSKKDKSTLQKKK
jgi:predicted DNA-binding protein (MmcQ/YjbR family)